MERAGFIVRDWGLPLTAEELKDRELTQIWFVVDKTQHLVVRAVKAPALIDSETMEIFLRKIERLDQEYLLHELNSPYEIVYGNVDLDKDLKRTLEHLMPTVKNWDDVIFEDFRRE